MGYGLKQNRLRGVEASKVISKPISGEEIKPPTPGSEIKKIKSNFVVIAYYTRKTEYANHARKLIESLKKFNLSYEIEAIDSLGNWLRNTQYKPEFIKKMLEKYHPIPLVYIDVDAVFCSYPILFDNLTMLPGCNIAVHVLNHTKYRRKDYPPELLSGTIFLKNNEIVNKIINEWIARCKADTELWDQRALKEVVGDKFYDLPEEYCTIFDYMASVENPVIKHFAAARKHRILEKY